MLHLRRQITNVIGVLALLALVVPPAVQAGESSTRARAISSAIRPVGGPVTQQELPGCSTPSEPFAGPSQGCASSRSSRGEPEGELGLVTPYDRDRGPRQSTSIDGSFNRGPRQSTSIDG